ncbi:MAG TPA: nucleotidyltransferase domain-containing protein [Armatimonadota bacterium]|nr:nucleotidyltransferase domain-containing protein [Armatimonadota bacterium]
MRLDDNERGRGGNYPELPLETLKAAAEALAASRADVDAIYLFGSRARGTTRPSSDLDFAVLLREQPDDRLYEQEEISSFLEDRLQIPVDVVIIHPDLSPSLLFDIFCVETILYTVDYEQAHRVAYQARNEYRDLKPRLDRIFERACSQIKVMADELNEARAGTAAAAQNVHRSPPAHPGD